MRNFIHGVTPPPQRAANDPASSSIRTAARMKTAAGEAVAITQRVFNRIWMIAIVMGVFFIVLVALIALG